MSLQERTILITRQREQSAEFIAEVERRGGRAVMLPMISIQDPDSWEECDRALLQLKSYDALVFTSTNSVDKFLQRCVLRSIEPIVLRHLSIYAAGEKTRQSLEQRGLPVAELPEQFSSAGLAEVLTKTSVAGKRFLYPRGDLGRADLVKALIQRGAMVDPVVVYRNAGPDEVDAELVYRRLVAGEIDVITFASPSAAKNFVSLFPLEKMALMDKRITIAVIGPTTEEAVKRLGLRVDIMAPRATVVDFVNAIDEYYER